MSDPRADRPPEDASSVEAQSVARLRGEVLIAAEREAAGIVVSARADIRRIILNARRELLGLAEQVQFITQGQTGAENGIPGIEQRVVLADAEQEVRIALNEARADLDTLASEALNVGRVANRGTDETVTPPTIAAAARPEPSRSAETTSRSIATDLSSSPVTTAAPPRLEQATSREPTLLATPAAPSLAPPAPPLPPRWTPPQRESTVSLEDARAALHKTAVDAILAKRGTDRPGPALRESQEPWPAWADPSVSTSRGFDSMRAPAPVDDRPYRLGSTTKVSVAAFSLLSVFVVLGTVWWLRSGSPSVPATQEQGSVAEPARRSSAESQPETAAAPASTAPTPTAAAPTAPLSLRVDIERPTWIRTTIDGKSDSGSVVRAGMRRKIDARREVSLFVGDAGAVKVSVNGAPPTAIGRDGEAKTGRFAAGASAPQSTVGSQPTTPAVVRSEAKPPAAAVEIPPGTRDELTNAAGRWLDAYYRNDLANMANLATVNMTLTDQRPMDQRLPAGLSNVRRTLERVSFQFTGNTAILSGRMTEQADVDGQPREIVSWISQLWMRDGGRWQLAELRLLDNGRLK